MFKPNRFVFLENPGGKPEKQHEIVGKFTEAEKATGREFINEEDVQDKINAAENRINQSPVNDEGKARMKKELARLIEYKEDELSQLNSAEGSKIEDVYARTLIELNGYMKDLGKFEKREIANEEKNSLKEHQEKYLTEKEAKKAARAEKLKEKAINEIEKLMDEVREMKKWAEWAKFNHDKGEEMGEKRGATKFKFESLNAMDKAFSLYYSLVELKTANFVDLSVLSGEERKATKKEAREAAKYVEKIMKEMNYEPNLSGKTYSGPLG
jgi:hypothetical protein